MKKRRVLKGVYETMLSNITIIEIMFIMFTIETLNQPLNQIINYLFLVGILTISIIVKLFILFKYGKNFKSLFEEE